MPQERLYKSSVCKEAKIVKHEEVINIVDHAESADFTDL